MGQRDICPVSEQRPKLVLMLRSNFSVNCPKLINDSSSCFLFFLQVRLHKSTSKLAVPSPTLESLMFLTLRHASAILDCQKSALLTLGILFTMTSPVPSILGFHVFSSRGASIGRSWGAISAQCQTRILWKNCLKSMDIPQLTLFPCFGWPNGFLDNSLIVLTHNLPDLYLCLHYLW